MAEVLRPADPSDAPRIVELIRGGFDPEILTAFIYGCHGITTYVARAIEAAEVSDTRYFVVERDGRVEATLEMRLLPDRLFLNYVAVDVAARKRRFGSRLLAEAIERLARPAHTSLSLDVLETNLPAARWYDALELATEAATCWHALTIPPSGATTAVVSGWVQAQLCYRELGFSQFSVSSGDQTYAIGMLGSAWFRVTSARALADAALAAVLRTIDPERRVLALLPASEPVSGSTILTRTIRRTAPLADVRRRLEAVA